MPFRIEFKFSRKIFRLCSTVCLVAFFVFLTMRSGSASEYYVQELVRGSPLRGVQGLTFGPDGELYAGSIVAQSIYRVDIDTGTIETIVNAPLGGADDLVVGDDGSIFWTAIAEATVRVRRPNGDIEDIAQRLFGVNGINFDPDGRLLATQLITPSKLFEIDPMGENPPRLIMETPGKLNGFEVDDSFQLFGPLSERGAVARVDLKSLTMTEISVGMTEPISVNLDADGNVLVVDYETGEVMRINPANGKRDLIVQLQAPIDNLAVGANGLIYVSRPAIGHIDEIDPQTGSWRPVVDGWLTGPGGITMIDQNGQETLLIADIYGHRFVDPTTGTVTVPKYTQWISGATAAVVANGFVYASNVIDGAVHVFDRETNDPLYAYKGLKAPYDILALDDGGVLVSEFGAGRIVRLGATPDDDNTVIAEGLEGPVGFARNGNVVYVTEALTGAVSRFDLDNGSIERLTEGLKLPEGVALLPDGKLVVAEVGKQRLVVIDPTTAQIETLIGDLPIDAPLWRTPEPVYLMTDVAVGLDGTIYLSSDQDNSLLTINRQDAE